MPWIWRMIDFLVRKYYCNVRQSCQLSSGRILYQVENHGGIHMRRNNALCVPIKPLKLGPERALDSSLQLRRSESSTYADLKPVLKDGRNVYYCLSSPITSHSSVAFKKCLSICYCLLTVSCSSSAVRWLPSRSVNDCLIIALLVIVFNCECVLTPQSPWKTQSTLKWKNHYQFSEIPWKAWKHSLLSALSKHIYGYTCPLRLMKTWSFQCC